MTDDELSEEEFLGDVAVRLIERDVLANDIMKLALVLSSVLDNLTQNEENDDAEVVEFKRELLSDIVTMLMYGVVKYQPTEEQIDSEVKTFAEWLSGATEPKQEEDPNGNS